eukprot:scaffold261729_cov29-Tisochrysis_lutea.AAC.5
MTSRCTVILSQALARRRQPSRRLLPNWLSRCGMITVSHYHCTCVVPNGRLQHRWNGQRRRLHGRFPRPGLLYGSTPRALSSVLHLAHRYCRPREIAFRGSHTSTSMLSNSTSASPNRFTVASALTLT